jgi:hypothetical protein
MTRSIDVPNSWVMVPSWRAGATPTPDTQRWLMTLSGIATIDFQGKTVAKWNFDTIDLHLDWQSPVHWAYGRPTPSGKMLAFKAEQFAQTAGLASIYDAGQCIDGGFSVNDCRPILWGQVWAGLQIDVAARDNDAFVHRVAFTTTVLGTIILTDAPN